MMLLFVVVPFCELIRPFVDDVIIASGDPSMSYKELLEAHERDVTRVPDLLVQHKLTGSSDKAIIAVSEVVFAGHIVFKTSQHPQSSLWFNRGTYLHGGNLWTLAETCGPL